MKKILIIDDDPIILSLMQAMLSKHEYITKTAGDGHEGLEMIKHEQFDVVVTDLIMPQIDGMEVIKKVRKQSPETKIIAISGGGRIDADVYLQMAERMQEVATLCKPFTAKDLIKTIEHVTAVPEKKQNEKLDK